MPDESGGTQVIESQESPREQAPVSQATKEVLTPELTEKINKVFNKVSGQRDESVKAKYLAKAKGQTQELAEAAEQNKPAPTRKAKKPQLETLDDGDAVLDEADGGEQLAKKKPAGKPKPKPGPRYEKPSTESADDSDVVEEAADDEAPESKDDSGDPDAPTLDPALRHAARRAGWTNEEIDDFLKLDPEKAERTFDKLYDSYNDLSASFRRIGEQGGHQQPAQPQQQRQRHQQPPTRQRPEAGNGDSDLLSEVFGDLERFTDLYGENFVDDVLRPIESRVLSPMQEMIQRVRAQESEAIAREVMSTMKGFETDFADVYGKGERVSREQQTAREQVYTLADQIRSGAQLQGVSMSVGEAIDRAHLMFNRQRIAERERKRLTEQVRRRSQSLTARPTQRNSELRPGPKAKTVKGAIAAAAKKMAELGLDDSD